MSRSTVKTSDELKVVREAAVISTEILAELRDAVKVGVDVSEIDNLAAELCEKRGVKPAFKGVPGRIPFPGNMCICINDTVLHAIPTKGTLIKRGDLVKLDFGIIHQGFYTDQCVTVGVEELSEEDEKLIKIGKLAVESAVKKVAAGNSTGDLGNAMQTIAQMAGYDVLKDYVGHAIGRNLHEWPQIPAYGDPHNGDILLPGMVLCVEAQIVAGDDEVYTASDHWSIRTRDGKNAVMFEYMVEVEEEGYKLLTDTTQWPLIVG